MASSKPNKQENHWCQPKHPLWKENDGDIIHEFYERYVETDRNEWHRNGMCVDTLLGIVHEVIKTKAEEHPEAGIVHKHFIRMGSSREGAKVSHPDEFDAVFPFTFKAGKIEAEVVESPRDGLPAGTAKIKVSEDCQINKLFAENDYRGQKYLSARNVHDKYFKGLVDMVVEKIENGELAKAFNAKLLPYDVRIVGRVANPPAITVTLEIKDRGMLLTSSRKVSVDIVPSFELPNISNRINRTFYVPKWSQMERNEKLREKSRDPNLTWRISHSRQELNMFRPDTISLPMPKRYRRKRRFSSNCLISTYRILKALRNFDKERKETSQFGSVLKSYHLKNIFLHSLTFIYDDNFNINCVSHALAIQVRLLERTLNDRKLPLFTDGITEHTFVPCDGLRQNLFGEISRDSLWQVDRDFQNALECSGLRTVVNRYLKPRQGKVKLPNAVKRVDKFYDRCLGLQCDGFF